MAMASDIFVNAKCWCVSTVGNFSGVLDADSSGHRGDGETQAEAYTISSARRNFSDALQKILAL
jgi:hypothetical protein